MWRDYRDLLVRKFCPGCAAELAAAAAARRPLANSCASRRGAYRILVAVRTHDPGSSSFLFANGRGRRVVNVDALVAALAPLGDVEAFDPGLLPLGDQIRKAASADVLVSRMSSQVVLAMFVPPGGLAVELEAPDPSKLYYDHASTFGELAELFGHAFVRSTPRHDDAAGVLPAAVVGDRESCRDVCAGPPEFRIYIGFPTIKQCQDRCDAFALRLSKLETAPDAYFKPEWYKNWWLGDAEADVPAVVALVSEHLGCA